MAVGDVNGDGKPDVVFLENDGSVQYDGAGVLLNTTQPPPPGGGGGGGGGGALAAITRMTLSPKAFRAAPKGPSAVAARRRYGTKVAYALNEAASLRFTVVQPRVGRKARNRRCVKPTRANRHAARCTRFVAVRGSFKRAGTAGANSFLFTGRMAGRNLKPGKYKLVATPTAGGKKGRAARSRFRIIK
jgi:hypothetical protein